MLHLLIKAANNRAPARSGSSSLKPGFRMMRKACTFPFLRIGWYQARPTRRCGLRCNGAGGVGCTPRRGTCYRSHSSHNNPYEFHNCSSPFLRSSGIGLVSMSRKLEGWSLLHTALQPRRVRRRERRPSWWFLPPTEKRR